MSNRVFNFSAGPAMLPTEVLEASAKALVDYQGKGFGIAECSHRGKEFDGVLDEAIDRCKKLLSVPDTHDILFLQGGATQLFSTIPMNFLNGPADYVVGGEWSKKAAGAARDAYGERSASSPPARAPTSIAPRPAGRPIRRGVPARLLERDRARHRLAEWPEHPTLVVDASSEMMSRPHPVSRTALIYAGAQKNLGPVGRGPGDRAQGSCTTASPRACRRSSTSRPTPRPRAA